MVIRGDKDGKDTIKIILNNVFKLPCTVPDLKILA